MIDFAAAAAAVQVLDGLFAVFALQLSAYSHTEILIAIGYVSLVFIIRNSKSQNIRRNGRVWASRGRLKSVRMEVGSKII